MCDGGGDWIGLDTAPEVSEGLDQYAAYPQITDAGFAPPPVFRAQPRPKLSNANSAKDSYVNVLVELYPEYAAGGVDEVLMHSPRSRRRIARRRGT